MLSFFSELGASPGRVTLPCKSLWRVRAPNRASAIPGLGRTDWGSDDRKGLLVSKLTAAVLVGCNRKNSVRGRGKAREKASHNQQTCHGMSSLC